MSKNQTIEDWFESGNKFAATLKQATNNASLLDDEVGLDFCIDIETKWSQYGMRMFLSEAQYAWLIRLAD